MKRLLVWSIITFVIISTVFGFPLQTFGQSSSKVKLNNELIDNSNFVYVKGDVEYFLLRDIANHLGVKIVYSGGILSGTHENGRFKAKDQSKIVDTGIDTIVLDNDIQLVNGRFYVPIDFFNKVLGLNVRRSSSNTIYMDSFHSEFSYEWAEKNMLVAHAFGSIDGKTYSNSLEAFEYNYSRGFRVFEVDFALTSDGHLVARHDWTESLQKQLEQDIPISLKNKPLSLDEFKSYPIYQKYTPISFEEIARLMVKYDDMYIITDTKETLKPEVTTQFNSLVETANRIDPNILDRVIPQIYNEKMFEVVMDIYKFKSVIYTLYNRYSFNEEDAIKFAYENGIGIITTYEARYSDEFVRELNDRGIKTYMHTFNSLNKILQYKEKGVHGFYTDFILP